MDKPAIMDLFWMMIEDSIKRPELYPDYMAIIAASDANKFERAATSKEPALRERAIREEEPEV